MEIRNLGQPYPQPLYLVSSGMASCKGDDIAVHPEFFE